MQIGSSNGLQPSAPIAGTSALGGPAPGDSPKQKLINLRLEDVLKTMVKCTLEADDALELKPAQDANGALGMEEKVPVDLKEIQKMRIPAEDTGVEDNSTFDAPAGVSAGSGLARQHAQRLARDAQMLDGLMVSLSK